MHAGSIPARASNPLENGKNREIQNSGYPFFEVIHFRVLRTFHPEFVGLGFRGRTGVQPLAERNALMIDRNSPYIL